MDELSLLESCLQVYPLASIVDINDSLDCFRLNFAVLANAQNRSWVLEFIRVVCIWEYRDDIVALLLDSRIHWLVWPNNQGNIVVCHELVDANLSISQHVF